MFLAGSAFIVLLAASSAASAQVTDAAMSCADYLKAAAAAGPTPKTGDAAADKMVAEVEAKMKTYCTANPKANAMEASMKMMGG